MDIVKANKIALVFGATGLVGKQLVLQLLVSSEYQKVKVFVRSPLAIDHAKLDQTIINDFSTLDQYRTEITGHVCYLCLGTTIKKAGSKKKFRSIDFELNFKIAKFASLNKVDQLVLISSAGADANSMVFYSKIKGELEDAIRALPFWAIHIFRPAFLLGKRSESRTLESAGQSFSSFLDKMMGPALSIYRPIKAEMLALSMIKVASKLEKGTFIYASHTAVELANN